MSYQASTWVAGECGVSPGEKLLLFAIANRVDECGVGFPGRERLAREACCRPETITANMKKLADRGLIARFERRRENGSRTSDWIVLAPRSAGRAPLDDAEPGEHPDAVVAAAQSSGEESPGEDFAPSQVKKTGGPEQSEEQTTLLGANAPHKVSVAEQVREVWEHYQEARDHGDRCKLTPQRRLVIKAAIGIRSVDECKAAITAMLGDEWYVSRGLTDIAYALRGGGRSPNPEATIDRLVAQSRNGHSNGNGKGGLLSEQTWPDGRKWDDLTPAAQAHAKEALARGERPWEPREDPPPRVNGHGGNGVVTAATFADVD